MPRKYVTFSEVDNREAKKDEREDDNSGSRSPQNVGWPMSGGHKDDARESVSESSSRIVSRFYSLIFAEEKKGEKL